MDAITIERMQRACHAISTDMEQDVARFDGAPVNGRTLATIHGNLAAAISALAGMVALLAENA